MAKKLKKIHKYHAKPIRLQVPGRGPVTLPVGDALQKARALMGQQQWPQAVRLLMQVTEQVPKSDDAWAMWFSACHSAGDFPQMETAATQCLAHNPRSVQALIARSTALRMQQRHPQALPDIEKAVKLEPANALVLNHLGILQKELGQLDAALKTFNRCIAIRPDYTQAYWNRSDLLNKPSDEQLLAMQQCLQKKGITANQKARMHYALARAYEFLGDDEQYFFHVEQGASCKRQAIEYDHQGEMEQMAGIPQCFTPEVLKQATLTHDIQSTPIFICGLPRSGTTLIEQILSCHEEVTAGDELTALPYAAAQCLRMKRNSDPFPAWAKQLSAEDWHNIGQLYLEHTRRLQTQRFFTDKNLQNYKAIGLIHLALPEAKIIFCRRDPMDNLWGCYRQLFGDGMLFTYNQTELAETWNAAEQVLAYWQAQLGDKLFVLDYEHLIADQEKVTRQLLSFIGLPWSEQCLKFYENARAVNTISSLQVRQPLTKSRIGQWKRFENQLTEMKAALTRLKTIES